MSTPARPADADPTPNAAARAALWANLRLVVIDTETTSSPAGLHIVEVAAVTCRRGRVTSRTWVARTNPGVPIDDYSRRIHGITDDDVDDEPSFELVEPELTRRLVGTADETVVICVYNAGFDIGVLRAEYKRAGVTLPDLPVLDVMRLPRALGLRPPGGRLTDLLTLLGLSNAAAHTAAGDADATAAVALRLLETAADSGWTDFTQLHEQAMAGKAKTTRTIRGVRKILASGEELFESRHSVPSAHAAGHQQPSNLRSRKAQDEWVASLVECGTLRCGYADARVDAAAAINPTVTRDLVSRALRNLTAVPEQDREPGSSAEVDHLAVATVLGAALQLFDSLSRADAYRWHDVHAPLLAAIRRCDKADPKAEQCPACRQRQPCPLDIWHQGLARASVDLSKDVKSLELTLRPPTQRKNLEGSKTGPGVWTSCRKAGRAKLADHLAWLTLDELRRRGQVDRADQLSLWTYQRGCRDPRVIAHVATRAAAAGSQTALERAVAICDDGLDLWGGSSDDGWQMLFSRRSQLLGRLARLRATVGVDDDGNDIVKRRHHPESPRRAPHPRRFSLET